MNITAYRKELESKGYKTKRVNKEYFAYKDGKYYYISIDNWWGNSLIEIDLETKKAEYAEPIRKAFKR